MNNNEICRQFLLMTIDKLMLGNDKWSQSNREKLHQALHTILANNPAMTNEAWQKIDTLLTDVTHHTLHPAATRPLADTDLTMEQWLALEVTAVERTADSTPEPTTEMHNTASSVLRHVAQMLIVGKAVNPKHNRKVANRWLMELIMEDLLVVPQMVERLLIFDSRVRGVLKVQPPDEKDLGHCRIDSRLIINLLGIMKQENLLVGSNETITNLVFHNGNAIYMGKGLKEYGSKYSSITDEMYRKAVAIIQRRTER